MPVRSTGLNGAVATLCGGRSVILGVGGVEVMSETDPGSFVRAHATDLMRSAILLTGSRVRAEDLVQETICRLLPQWDRVVRADSSLAYVRRSLVNRFVSQGRLAS